MIWSSPRTAGTRRSTARITRRMASFLDMLLADRRQGARVSFGRFSVWIFVMLAVIEFCWTLEDKVALGLLDFLLFRKVFF